MIQNPIRNGSERRSQDRIGDVRIHEPLRLDERDQVNALKFGRDTWSQWDIVQLEKTR